MNSKNLSFIIAILSILILTNCTKNNGIDNNSVIVKPYVLYFSGDRGELYKTNTGRLFNLVFPPDELNSVRHPPQKGVRPLLRAVRDRIRPGSAKPPDGRHKTAGP